MHMNIVQVDQMYFFLQFSIDMIYFEFSPICPCWME